MKFNIGIVNINYDCAATLDLAFEPWAKIKNGELNHLIDKVYISSKHVCFPETHSLNYPIYSNDGTIEKLNTLKSDKIIDDLEIYDFPTCEQVAWSENVPFLVQKNVNLLWMLNSDEVWTLEEIEKALLFIKTNPSDYYKVNFKNYFGRSKYTDSFIAPRIWPMDKNGGVHSFYVDDLVLFNSGKKDVELNHLTIPNQICFPCHYSWSLPPNSSDEDNKLFCKRKLLFQNIRYKNCSYRWNEEKDELEYNPEYYKLINKEIPETFYN